MDEQGWFRTGDLGVIGEDGYLRLVGRIKEMIRVGGENVAAAEIESVLLKHDAVKQAVAVGMADARLSEVVAVFIELRPEKHATEAGNRRFLPPSISPASKSPSREVRSNWPMTGAGKIQRYVLKESLLGHEGTKP